MPFCFFLFFFAFLLTPGFADDTVWNCHQDKNSKEWVCTGEEAPPSQASEEPLTHHPEPLPSEPAAVKEIRLSEPTPIPETSTEAKPQPKVVVEKQIPVKTAIPQAITVKTKQPPEGIQQMAGWQCKAADGSQDWNCNLTGPDPKGQARIVASDEEVFSLLAPAFDSKQEQVFGSLVSQLKYDPWANCSIEPGPAPGFVPGRHLRDVSPLDVNADYGEVFENEISSYLGNVEITRADQRSLSHTAQYDSVSQTLDLQGEVYYSEDNLALYSNSANLKLAQDQATLRNVQFINPSAPLRGRASAAYRESKTLSRYKEVAYTSCPPGNSDWVVHASDLKLNEETGKGAAKDAWLEFKGVPVFYSPYLSFPVDNRRLSGFLAPSFGNTQRGGFNFSVPYYWNIAPNYDATLRPRYYGKRGLMLAGDFRLLTKYSNGSVGIEYMPNDELRKDSRFLGSLKNTSHFGSHIYSNLDLNYVSDKEYFGELGSALSFPYRSHVRSTADLGYTDASKGVSLRGRIENYQTIDKTLTGFDRPYRRLPQFNLDLNHAFDFMPLNANLDGEYVNFQHNDLVDGQRFNIKPWVSSPLRSEWGFITPKVSLQNTNYLLNNQTAGKPDSISRTLPIFSLDNGLFFDRNLGFGSSSLKQTLEPRLFYLYIPRKDQKDIPIFDTSLYDFWFTNLFRENRFSGSDRIQDANQITLGLTSRLFDAETGREKLKLSLGEILYFQNREVTAPVRLRYLPGVVQRPPEGLESPIETESLSPIIAELSGAFSDYWKGETGIQWSPETNDIVGGKAILHYDEEGEKIFNVGFRFRQNDLPERILRENECPPNTTGTPVDCWYSTDPNYDPLKDKKVLQSNDMIQSDVNFRWPVANTWYAVGRWSYSWLFNSTQEAFFGFEKENCCWRFRVVGRRWTNNYNTINSVNSLQTEGTSQTGIFFQIELKGLTGIGEDLDTFFEQSIYGYRKPVR